MKSLFMFMILDLAFNSFAFAGEGRLVCKVHTKSSYTEMGGTGSMGLPMVESVNTNFPEVHTYVLKSDDKIFVVTESEKSPTILMGIVSDGDFLAQAEGELTRRDSAIRLSYGISIQDGGEIFCKLK